MFNCKIAIAKLSALVLVLGMTTAHAMEKADVGAVASPAGLQSERGASRVTRSRYNSSNVVVAVKPIVRTTHRVRGGSAVVGAASPTLAHSAVTTKSASATKRSRYPSKGAANELIRLADLKQ